MTEAIFQAAGELLGYGMVLGFAAGAFIVLVTTGLCSAFHTFVKIIGGKEE